MTTSTQQDALQFELNDCGIATLWLDADGKSVVVLNRDLIQRLNTTLDAIEQVDGIKGLVLRSNCGRVFVAGADLSEIDRLDDHSLHTYLAFGTTVFARVASLPYPTVAAINGAALGGGLEIAMHCDALVISATNIIGKPFPVGLPEAGLGICPGWGGSQLLPSRIDPETGINAAATGNTFMSNALPTGLATTVVHTPDELQDAAIDWIDQNKSYEATVLGLHTDNSKGYEAGLANAIANTQPSDAATSVFLAVETGIKHGWTAAVATEQCELVRLRNTPVAREKLEAFLSKG
jgi:enoyl-CoA hydratase/carnithine racemase